MSEELPNQPAALLIYDARGCAPVLCLDLDSSRGLVDEDLTVLTALLRRAGCRWFSDHSPNGGRHVYVPLATPAPFLEARAVTAALAVLAPTLDQQPMTNLSAGCIRPPGARHRTGGHQVLDGPLEAAEAILGHPNTPAAWERLLELLNLTPDHAPVDHDERRVGVVVDVVGDAHNPGGELGQLPGLPGFAEPDQTFQRTARTGEYDPGRYATPSEARQGVVWAAAAAGWAFLDVARRIDDGTWPGLASFYARYTERHRHQALVRDWRTAIGFEKRRRHASGKKTVRTRPTSPHKTQRGHPHPHRQGHANTYLRSWLAAVDLLHGPDSDLVLRCVLYALAEAGALTDSAVIEHGNRSLAIATGADQRTVGRSLRKLLDEPEDRALVELVHPARGVRAHTLHLRIPALLRPACETKAWRRGRIHALRPAFRELGRPAAFVYAALEQLDDPTSGRAIAQAARIGHETTAEALKVISSWGLATRTPQGWALTPDSRSRLTVLAEAWGVTDAVCDQVERYRAERVVWRAWLTSHGVLSAAPPDYSPRGREDPGGPRWPDLPEAELLTRPPSPLGDDESLLQLLGRVLGAVPAPPLSA